MSLHYLTNLVWSMEFQAVLYAISLTLVRHKFKILAFFEDNNVSRICINFC